MKRITNILIATCAALALTASLALAADAVSTQRDTSQTTPWQQCLGDGSGYMSQNGYGHMGGNGSGHMGYSDRAY